MQKILIAVGVIVLALGAWFFLKGSAPITNYPPKNEVIVAFGDSLVFGQGSTKGNDFVSGLERKIGRPIINLGVSGNTTGDGLARIGVATDVDPGIVILLLGGNDFLKRVPEATIVQNLSTLIETFQAQGAVVVLLGVRSGILSNNAEALYTMLAKKYGVPLIPNVLDGVYLHRELMSDAIHPNDAGYAIITEELYQLFRENRL